MVDQKRPNFLIILADDLGFSDITPYGSEIRTPNLEALAREGIRMTDFHTAAACSPTRAMVMSGTDAHLAGVGNMQERKKGDPAARLRWNDRPGTEGFLNKHVAALPELMQDKGYHTILAGKWHLGTRPDYNPKYRGFDKSFALLPGCCNHFMWEPQLADPSEYQPSRPIHTENGLRAKLEPNTTSDPKQGAYSSDLYTDKLIQFLDDRTAEEAAKPFFAYYAFSAPHWPLQAPRELIDSYKGMYDDGPYELRKRRLASLKKLGIIAEDVTPHDVLHPVTKDWSELTDEQRAMSSRAYETYAAMVTRMDECMGRVFEHLKKTGEWDNTFILFASDNGADGAAWEALPLMGAAGKMLRTIRDHYDNALENIGNYNSFTWVGPLWGQAATAPSRLFKSHASEGGILVPCIAKYPKFDQEFTGSFSRAFTTCMDIAPTVLELAGIEHPAKDVKNPLDKAPFRDTMVYPMRGKSWVPYLIDNKPLIPDGIPEGHRDRYAVYPADEYIGWELFANAALRLGKWKLVHEPKAWGGNAEGDEGWQLYDLVADPAERIDLSDEHPEVKAKLLQHWEEYVQWSGTVWGEGATAPIPADRDTSLLHDDLLEQINFWVEETAIGHEMQMPA